MYGYNNKSDFFTVRRNILSTASNLTFTSEEKAAVEKALHEVFGDKSLLFCTINDSAGKIITGNPTLRTSIYDADDKLVSGSIPITGSITHKLDVGRYKILITCDGYNSWEGYVDISEHEINSITVKLRKGNGKASGTVSSATSAPIPMSPSADATGGKLAGVTINVRAGLNAKTGTILQTIITDAEGNYSFSGNTGDYTIELVKSGYITKWETIRVRDGEIANQDATMYADKTETIDLLGIIAENSPELFRLIEMSEKTQSGTGYGRNGRFLAPIGAPDADSIPISNRGQLEAIVNDAASRRGKYHLVNDIDLGGAEWTPLGTTTSNSFTGTFDGQGYVIKNLTITRGTHQYAGLFGYASSNAEIKMLG